MVMQTKVFAKRGLQNDNTNQGLDFKCHILYGNIFTVSQTYGRFKSYLIIMTT